MQITDGSTKAKKTVEKGDKVVVKMLKQYDNHRRVQIGENTFAKIEDIEYADVFLQPDQE